MKRIFLVLAFLTFGLCFSKETNLFSAEASADFEGYNYEETFSADSTSGHFTTKDIIKLENKDWHIHFLVNAPDTNTNYGITHAYPSFLNESDKGPRFIENAGYIKFIKVFAKLYKPYNEIYLLYSISPIREIKEIKFEKAFIEVTSMQDTILNL